MRPFRLLAMFALFGACGTMPDVAPPPAGEPGLDDYPTFLPIDRIEMTPVEQDAEEPTPEEVMEARVSGLRARAARLRSAGTN